MRKRKYVWRWAVMVLLAVVLLGQGPVQVVTAQQQGGGRRGRRWDPAQMRQRMLERVKQNLGANEEEWKVLQPRIEKVQTLARQTRVMQFRRRGRAAGEDQDTSELSGVAKLTQELRELIDKQDTPPEKIKAKMTELRNAREKAKEELAKAQAELQEIVTVRQEAQLMLMGLLD